MLEYDWDERSDYDETDNDYSLLLDVGQYQEQTTHELQLTSTWTDKSWNYLLGLYYLDDKNEQPYNINAPGYATLQTISDLAGTSWENPLGIFYYQKGVLDNESWAAYGELGFDLSDTWALTVGARYSEDDYNGGETQLRYYDLYREFGFVELPFAFDASVDQFAGDPTRYVDGIDVTHEDEFDNVTGKVNLSYRPWVGHLFWGTVANGYKMGGVRLGSLEAEFLEADGGIVASGQFDQEDMIMYELGWKAELLDNTLRSELVGFFYTYDDMQQLRNFKTDPPASINLDEVINVDTEMYGIEATATYLITDNLRAIVSYSYNHTEITSDAFFENWEFGERDETNQVIPENVKGNQLALTPEHKGALSLHYLWPTSVGEFTLGGTYAYVGERYFDLGNHVSEGSYTRLDMRASWTSENGRYQVMGVVNNATDEEMFNTRSCDASDDGIYGTPSFIVRCSGNPMNQRIYTAQFIVRI